MERRPHPVTAIVLGCEMELGGLVVRQLLRSNLVYEVYALTEIPVSLVGDHELTPREAIRLRVIVRSYDLLESTLAELSNLRRIMAFSCTGLSYLVANDKWELHKHNYDYPVRFVAALLYMDLIRVSVLSSIWRLNSHRNLLNIELKELMQCSWTKHECLQQLKQPSIAIFCAPILLAADLRTKGAGGHVYGTKHLPRIEMTVQRIMHRFALIDKADYRISVRDVARAMFFDAREHVYMTDSVYPRIHMEALNFRFVKIEGLEMEELASRAFNEDPDVPIGKRTERRVKLHWRSNFDAAEFEKQAGRLQIAEDGYAYVTSHPMFRMKRPSNSISARSALPTVDSPSHTDNERDSGQIRHSAPAQDGSRMDPEVCAGELPRNDSPIDPPARAGGMGRRGPVRQQHIESSSTSSQNDVATPARRQHTMLGDNANSAIHDESSHVCVTGQECVRDRCTEPVSHGIPRAHRVPVRTADALVAQLNLA